MKKLFTLVVLMCLLGVNRVWAGNDFIFFGTGLDNIYHNIVKPRSTVDEVATVDCYFRYYNPSGNYLKTDGYVNYNFKAEIIGDLTMDEGSALQNGQERGDFSAMFQIKFKGRGGAIIVTAKHKNYDNETYGWATFFVITAPYIGNQTWDFFTNPNTEMTYYHANNRYEYWKPGTKFNGHEDRPIRVVDMDYDKEDGKRNDGHDNIDGTNARYLPATAGLVFTCPDEGFGVNDNTKINPANNEPYRPNKYVVLGKNGSKFTIPHLEGGTYIRIWWDPINAGEFGGHYKAENVLDLDGNYISNTFMFSGVTDYDKCQGNTIFKVSGNKGEYKDVTFTLNDDGWTDIYKIQVMDTYETDMILADGTAGWSNMHTVLYNNDFGTIVHDGTGAQRLYSGHSGKSHIQRARTLNWEVSSEGDVTYTSRVNTWTHDQASYDDLILNITGGSGNIRIIQREKFDGYTLDKNETWIAVGTYKKQSYPYTWDFMDWNMKQKSMLGVLDDSHTHGFAYGYWNTASDDVRSLETHALVDASKGNNNFVWNNVKVDRPLFAQGAQLSYRDFDQSLNKDEIVPFKEAEGLRIKQMESSTVLGVGEAFDGEISFDGNCMGFNRNDNSHKLVITIPEIPYEEGNEMWIFIKATAQPNKVYAAVNTDQYVILSADEGQNGNPDTYNTQDDVWAYKVTKAGDVEILYNKNTSIKAIGVTNIFKEINALGYATESRNHAIDHEYEGVFTKNDVNAYCIQTYDDQGFTYNYKGTPEVKKSTRVHFVPKNTGIVLYADVNQSLGSKFNVPLFYPACNASLDLSATSAEYKAFRNNWMAPCVNEYTHEDETVNRLTAMKQCGENGINGYDYGTNNEKCTKFVMSRQYYIYNKTYNSDSEEKTSEQEAFYRMRLKTGGNNTMGANKAYLLIPTTKLPLALWDPNSDGEGIPGQAKPGVIFMDDIEALFGGEEPFSGIATAIDAIESTETVGNGNTFHTLSGMQIQGVPTQKGVYIVNGKKVLVK